MISSVWFMRPTIFPVSKTLSRGISAGLFDPSRTMRNTSCIGLPSRPSPARHLLSNSIHESDALLGVSRDDRVADADKRLLEELSQRVLMASRIKQPATDVADKATDR